jgi:hypothetical protein
MAGIAPFGPGHRVGVLALPLTNATSEPLTLDSVEIKGRGVGGVVRVVETRASPETGGRHSFPGGVWTTDPPVLEIDGVCHSPVLRSLHGFVLRPGAIARIWVVFESLKPGAFRIPSQTVVYEQGGSQYQQVMDYGYYGKVVAGLPGPKMDPAERACLKKP